MRQLFKQMEAINQLNFIQVGGSVLLINPAKDLSIGSPYLANGSRGNYNLQKKLNITNHYSGEVTSEIMIACKNTCYLKNYPGAKSTLQECLICLFLVLFVEIGRRGKRMRKRQA
jgi:hypothetical protein